MYQVEPSSVTKSQSAYLGRIAKAFFGFIYGLQMSGILDSRTYSHRLYPWPVAVVRWLLAACSSSPHQPRLRWAGTISVSGSS